MSEQDKIQLFENQKIRTAWDAETEEWYFSVADVVQVLTDSVDPKQYIKKMRSRDPELGSKWGTICTPAHRRKRGCVCDNCVDNDSNTAVMWHCP